LSELPEWNVLDDRQDLAREPAWVVDLARVWLPLGALALPRTHRGCALVMRFERRPIWARPVSRRRVTVSAV
jgi:hypothetical protein